MRSGISVKGRFIKDLEVEKYIRKIIGSFKGLEGPIGFQLKKSQDNEFLLLECNPRIQGTSVSAMGLGLNIPLIILDYITFRIPKINNKTDGVSFSRYYDEIYYET